MVPLGFIGGVSKIWDRGLAHLDPDVNGGVATGDRCERARGRKPAGADYCGRRLCGSIFGASTDLVPLLRPLRQNPRAHERKNVPQPTGRLIPSFVEERYEFPEEKQKPYSEFHPVVGVVCTVPV